MHEEREPNIDIVCGDCTELIKGINDDREKILVTDPPFNIGYKYNGYDDKMPESDYYKMLASIIGYCDGKAVIIHYPEALHRLSIELGEAPKKVITWAYNSNTRKQHRDIAFYGFEPKMEQVTQPYKNPNDPRIAERIARGIAGGLYMIGSSSTR